MMAKCSCCESREADFRMLDDTARPWGLVDVHCARTCVEQSNEESFLARVWYRRWSAFNTAAPLAPILEAIPKSDPAIVNPTHEECSCGRQILFTARTIICTLGLPERKCLVCLRDQYPGCEARVFPVKEPEPPPTCAECSSPATHGLFCCYCSDRKRLEASVSSWFAGPGRVSAASARMAAMDLASLPRVTATSRELEKAHPWESWSTVGDES